MKNKLTKVLCIFFLLMISLAGIIMAADFTPQGDINLRGVYAIKNATNITSGDITSSGNISAVNFNGNLTSNSFNLSEMEKQGDGKIGILDSFINSLIDLRVINSYIRALGFYNQTESNSTYVNVDGDTMTGNLVINANATANWFKGLFNWTTGDSYTSFDGATLTTNETKINETIDARSQILNVNSSNYWDSLGSFNSSEMEQESNGNLGILDSFINGLIDTRVIMSYIQALNFYNTTQVDTEIINANTSMANYVNNNFINKTEEPDLNVNSSNYWDSLDSINGTQMENSGGVLNILESWLFSWSNGNFLNLSGTNANQNLNIENYNLSADYVKANVDWTNLTNYPVACPANSYLTQLDDSVTCTEVVDIPNGGNANFSEINNVLYVQPNNATDLVNKLTEGDGTTYRHIIANGIFNVTEADQGEYLNISSKTTLSGNGIINLNYPSGIHYAFNIANKSDIVIKDLTFTAQDGVRMGFMVRQDSSNVQFLNTKFIGFGGVQAIVFIQNTTNVHLDNIFVNQSYMVGVSSPHTSVYFNYGNVDGSLQNSRIYHNKTSGAYCVAIDDLNEVLGNTGILIQNNIISDCWWGTHIEGSKDTLISNNKYYNDEYSIETGRTNQNLKINDNIIVGGTHGMRLHGQQPTAANQEFSLVTVQDNQVINASSRAIKLDNNATNFQFFGNVIKNSDVAFLFETQAHNITIKNNYLEDNVENLRTATDSNNVLFEGNYYRGGTFDTTDGTNIISRDNINLNNISAPYFGWDSIRSENITNNLILQTDSSYSIGTNSLRFLKGWFDDFDVGGNLTIGKRIAFNSGVSDWIADQDISQIYGTKSGGSGVYPFNSFGNLVIQPRTSTDDRDIVFVARRNATDNQIIMMLKGQNKRVGIGTITPASELDVNGTITGVNLNITGNLTIGQKITFALGETIDNLVDGWIRITGGLNVTENLNVYGNATINENLTVNKNVEVAGNITGNFHYGEMWFNNMTAGVTTAIGVQDTWYNLTGFNSTSGVDTGQTLNGFTFSDADEDLTALIAGKYLASYSLSFANAGANQEYDSAISINGIIQNNTMSHRKIGAAGDVGDIGGTGILSLNVNDKIKLMVLNDDGTTDIIAHAANLNLMRIGN